MAILENTLLKEKEKSVKRKLSKPSTTAQQNHFNDSNTIGNEILTSTAYLNTSFLSMAKKIADEFKSYGETIDSINNTQTVIKMNLSRLDRDQVAYEQQTTMVITLQIFFIHLIYFLFYLSADHRK
jgi:hypothetical protein